MPQAIVDQLTQHGATWGAPETLELGRIANQSVPVLKTHDATGTRIDLVEYHPAYHALMRRSVASGLHCSVWDAAGGEANVRTVARAARALHDGPGRMRPYLPDDDDECLGGGARPCLADRQSMAAAHPLAPI